MDRPTTRTEADARSSRPEPHDSLVLPSRRAALELCRSASRIGEGEGATLGPVLVTGDAGVGKTWLWRRLEAESRPFGRWIAVDLTPSNSPLDFYRLIAHELGLGDPTDLASGSSTSRVALVDFLDGRRADGERVHLVVEEAHNLSSDLWEEVRVLANRLGRPGGFASMILAGQTALALRFSTRPFAAIETRLAARVHLGPVDVAEAKELLDRLRPGREWGGDEVEALHRDASGNPRRLLRMVRPTLVLSPPPRVAPRAVEPPKVAEVASTAPIASPAPLTGPARPPIRSDENMIEVGWSPEDAASPEELDDLSARRAGPPGASPGGEEAVQDHYAALQAWREWTENQARRAPQPVEAPDLEGQDEDEIEYDEEDEPTTLPPPSPNRADRPTVRAEGEQKFAPFGHLFSRMSQAREPE